MQALLIASLVLALLSLALTLVTHLAVRQVRRRPPKEGQLPPISVLKPLKGVDDGLYENLESLACQDYPDFELILGCEQASDPALAVARRLQSDFPHLRIVVATGAAGSGLNPKVKMLRRLNQHARHDIVLVSDSNIRARPSYFAAMVSELGDPKVGLVSSLLVGTGERTLGARFDNLHMNSFIARAVCGAAVLTEHPCVVGKSMLFRRSVFQSLGGFEQVENVLAEDYVMGRCFADAGYRVALSSHSIESISVERSFPDFVARHLRWGQMRRHLMPLLYLLEPLQTPVPWLLSAVALVLAGAAPGYGPWLLPALVLGLALRMASDAVLVRALRGQSLTPGDYATLVAKDLVFLPIWLMGALKRTVSWRGSSLRIGPGSRLLPTPELESSPAALEGV